MKKIVLIFLMLLVAAPSFALQAIPGVYGHGSDTRGAYCASAVAQVICTVVDLGTGDTPTDLTYDASEHGQPVFEGSLGECLAWDAWAGDDVAGQTIAPNTGKIITFATSGVIDYYTADDGSHTGAAADREVVGDCVSIYGQTAPAPGITIRGDFFKIIKRSDIIIQHLRFRLDADDYSTYSGVYGMSITRENGTGLADSEDIVIDHNSFSWYMDDLAIYDGDADAGEGTKNVTFSNNLMGEPLLNPYSEENRAYCLQLSDYVEDITLWRNLMVHCAQRAPRVANNSACVVNNLQHNFKWRGMDIYDDASGDKTLDIIGNVYTKGYDYSPNSPTYANAPIQIASEAIRGAGKGVTDTSDIYISDTECSDYTSESGNCIAIEEDIDDCVGVDNPWDCCTGVGTGPTCRDLDLAVSATGACPADVLSNLLASNATKAHVIANVGAWPASRDSTDTCLIDDANTQSQTSDDGIISDNDDADGCGDAEALDQNYASLVIPANPHSASPYGYTNLEIWVMEDHTGPAEGRTISFGSTPDIEGMNLF